MHLGHISGTSVFPSWFRFYVSCILFSSKIIHKRLLQNFAHASTALLSWHEEIDLLRSELIKAKHIFHQIEWQAKVTPVHILLCGNLVCRRWLFSCRVVIMYMGYSSWVNSLAPGKFEWNFRYVIFKWVSVIDGWCISCDIDLIWMSLDFNDEQSTLVQVMAWCRQAPSHYLNQCWRRSLLPYGVTRPQWVKVRHACGPGSLYFHAVCSCCCCIWHQATACDYSHQH